MKKKFKPNQLIVKVLSCLLSLLGFSGCSSNEKEMLLMYGPPVTSHHLKGKVVDSEHKDTGLANIQVLVRPDIQNYHYADTLFTNKDGEFTYSSYKLSKSEIRLIYEDTENDVFKKDSIPVTMEWNEDGYDADVVIEMERKTTNQR